MSEKRFNLNTRSGYLHRNEVHEAGENSEEFDRADAADQWANRNGLGLQWCSTCFDGKRSTTEQAPATSAPRAESNNPRSPQTGEGAVGLDDDVALRENTN